MAGKTRRLHLTVIAPTYERAKAVVDRWEADPRFKALEESYGDRLAVQAFASSDAVVKDIGLPAGGDPDVVLQWDRGRVEYRAKTGPGVEAIVGEIRRRNPDYDPARAPDGAGLSGFLDGGAGWLVVGALALFLLFAGSGSGGRQ